MLLWVLLPIPPQYTPGYTHCGATHKTTIFLPSASNFFRSGGMAGLEVAGIIVRIVSAFTEGASLYRKWREKRRAKREAKRIDKENDSLTLVLTNGGADVQNEYRRHFKRLGPVFARGDGKQCVRHISRHDISQSAQKC